jgi:type II secretory pathway predicted ATPase ExeA
LLTRVKNESGEFARNAFMLLFNAEKWTIDFLKRRGIRAINLAVTTVETDSQAMYEERNRLLSAWLDELQQKIQAHKEAASLKIKSAAPERKLPAEPYKFLDFFTAGDSEIFHGRRQEAEWLVGLLLSSRLTILYGESGTGKTSLLQASVMLHPQLSDYRIVYARPLSDTLHEIRDELCRVLSVTQPVEGQKLGELIEASLPAGERLLLILDQFEELFIRQGAESRQKFIDELIEIVSLSQREVRCLLSLRSDYLDHLDELKLPQGRDPLRHRMRIYNLGAAEARAAITMPAKDFDMTIEPALLDQLLTDLI